MIETIKISSRGQIVIPEAVRKHLNLKEGARLILLEREKQLILETEENFMKKFGEQQEKLGWLAVAEKNMAKIWDNPKDKKIWNQYL